MTSEREQRDIWEWSQSALCPCVTWPPREGSKTVAVHRPEWLWWQRQVKLAWSFLEQRSNNMLSVQPQSMAVIMSEAFQVWGSLPTYMALCEWMQQHVPGGSYFTSHHLGVTTLVTVVSLWDAAVGIISHLIMRHGSDHPGRSYVTYYVGMTLLIRVISYLWEWQPWWDLFPIPPWYVGVTYLTITRCESRMLSWVHLGYVGSDSPGDWHLQQIPVTPTIFKWLPCRSRRETKNLQRPTPWSISARDKPIATVWR